MWRKILHIVPESIAHGIADRQDPELSEALSGLPEWRLRKALSYRFDIDRYTCAQAYKLLRELLSENYCITGDVEFDYHTDGKPFLKDYPEIHFNFSHCRRAVLCAVGDSPLGVDVEQIQYDPDLARIVLSPRELAATESSQDPALAFTELWTRKESLLKLLGTGLPGATGPADTPGDLRGVLDSADPAIGFHTEADPAAGIVWTVASR